MVILSPVSPLACVAARSNMVDIINSDSPKYNELRPHWLTVLISLTPHGAENYFCIGKKEETEKRPVVILRQLM
jgi:hypothetical protein